MLKRIIILLMLGLIFVEFASTQDKKVERTKIKVQPKVSDRFVDYVVEKEEYAVLQAVVKEKYGDKNERFVVINKKVDGCSFDIDRLYIIDELQKSGISVEILEELNKDCDSKKGDYRLKADSFKLKSKVILITAQELEKFFYPSCSDGWKNFYKKYPSSNGTMSLSRVGFNSGKNLAVINFGNQEQCLSGNGQIIFLQKDKGVWKIKKTQPTWIS